MRNGSGIVSSSHEMIEEGKSFENEPEFIKADGVVDDNLEAGLNIDTEQPDSENSEGDGLLGTTVEAIRDSLLHWKVFFVGTPATDSTGKSRERTDSDIINFINQCDFTASERPDLWKKEFAKSLQQILTTVKDRQHKFDLLEGRATGNSPGTRVESESKGKKKGKVTSVGRAGPEVSVTKGKRPSITEIDTNKVSTPKTKELSKKPNESFSNVKLSGEKQAEQSGLLKCLLVSLCWVVLGVIIYFPIIFFCFYLVLEEDPDFFGHDDDNNTGGNSRFCKRIWVFEIMFAIVLSAVVVVNYCIALCTKTSTSNSRKSRMRRWGPRISFTVSLMVLSVAFYGLVLLWDDNRDDNECEKSSILATVVVSCFLCLPLVCFFLNFLSNQVNGSREVAATS